jgi:RimJ/RimL family protein N-acetyltransferase
VLRPLEVSDVSQRYLSWLRDEVTKQFIYSAAQILDMASLRQYIACRLEQSDILFLGIFTKENGVHIGNIKFEPINSEMGIATMGILIGDPLWRGKGAASEAILASSMWLREFYNIKQINLGVSRANKMAIACYSRIGFVEKLDTNNQTSSAENMQMFWRIQNSRQICPTSFVPQAPCNLLGISSGLAVE